ncbi:succinate dehydrogenase [Halorarius litoreus]|uniref:succinate dehydrogenase n=1 Tax=Halorarius litoreus TaxID=2962676 RepID=UPI0020CD96EE|nr:succinate dehydrogenase [Halorarius litoreus]
MAEQYSSFDRKGSRWLLQRLTAAFLVVVLAFHFMTLHFVNHAAEVTFMGTQMRMQQPGYLITMIAFGLTATFHGVNGVYNALVNQGLDGTGKSVMKYVLVIAALVLSIQIVRLALVMAGVSFA